jgi:hypothetical protein
MGSKGGRTAACGDVKRCEGLSESSLRWSMPDTPGWLDNLRPQLERKNVASIAALEDYLSVIGDATPALWADLQGKLIVVYAITDDWLHVFRGPADDLPPPSSPDERYA